MRSVPAPQLQIKSEALSRRLQWRQSPAPTNSHLGGDNVSHAVEFRSEFPKSLMGRVLHRQRAEEGRAKRLRWN